MSITREVQLGMEVFAIDGPDASCEGCCFRHSDVSYCSNMKCESDVREDKRTVYFLLATDLKGQLLFHTQEQLCPSPSQSQ